MKGNYDNIEACLMNMRLSQEAINNGYKSMAENIDKTWNAMRDLHASLVTVSKGVIPREAIDDLDLKGCDPYIDSEGFVEMMNGIMKKVSSRARMGGYIQALTSLVKIRRSFSAKADKLHDRITYLIRTKDMGMDYRQSSIMKSKMAQSVGIIDQRIAMVLDGLFKCRLESLKDICKATNAALKLVNDTEVLRKAALQNDDSSVMSSISITMNKIKKDYYND